MKKKTGIESIFDINSSNIWALTGHEIAELWEEGKRDEEMVNSEEKMLNTIRLAFDVHHYNPADARDVERYESNAEYNTFSRSRANLGCVAIRKRTVRRISDISYENVAHVTTQQLLALISDNFGMGWDAIPLAVKDIIEAGFEVSTTTLPAKRLHAPGGTLEKKLADGFDVLEVSQGSWIEAIFVKKRELQEKIRLQNPDQYDEEGNRIVPTDEEGEPIPEQDGDEEREEEGADDEQLDETFYGTYIAEADQKDDEEDEEGHGDTHVEVEEDDL